MEEIKEQRNDEDYILEIVNSIEEGRRKAEGSLRVPGEQPCTIYKVPKVLRQVNEKSYEPQLVSIGPYHHDKEGLMPMKEKKFQYLLALLSRNPELKLQDFVKEIKELEARARKCYSESISLKSKEFVEMMIFDGCFLAEIFLRIPNAKINDELWLPVFITHDMLLLENQLPFFVLESIFSLVAPIEEADLLKKRILECCFDFIYILPLNEDATMKKSYHHVLDMFHHHCLPKQDPDMEPKSRTNPNADPRHIIAEPSHNARCSRPASSLAYIRIYRLLKQLIRKWRRTNSKDPPDIVEKRSHNARCSRMASSLACIRVDRLLRHLIRKGWPTNSEDTPFSIRSAEELQEAGIEIQRKEAELTGSLLEVEFDKKGVLKIPFLYFSDDQQTIFRNLIAFEQCYPEAGTFFSGYALFMDHLINTAKDVRILRHSGIIEHGLGSDDELARYFNELCGRILFQAATIHLFRERIAINVYCGKKWPTWRAKLMRNYFNSPWAILSLIAAVLLILLTITQTVFSIFPNV